jgi:hypothetical protein
LRDVIRHRGGEELRRKSSTEPESHKKVEGRLMPIFPGPGKKVEGWLAPPFSSSGFENLSELQNWLMPIFPEVEI